MLSLPENPPSASTNMSVIVNFNDPQREFVTRWSGATVGSLATIGGYNVSISGPDDGCGVRGVPQFTAVEQYQCPMPLVGETYTFSVFAVCGTLEGTAVVATVTLQGSTHHPLSIIIVSSTVLWNILPQCPVPQASLWQLRCMINLQEYC